MNDWTRREFLASTALAAASQADPKEAQAGKRGQSPHRSRTSRLPVALMEKLVLGFIGVGGMGSGLINKFKTFPDVAIAAVCDVYEPHLRRAQSSAGGTPETYADFRKVLGRKDIDAVVVASSRPFGMGSPPSWPVSGRQGRLLREAVARIGSRRRPSHGQGFGEATKRVTQNG